MGNLKGTFLIFSLIFTYFFGNNKSFANSSLNKKPHIVLIVADDLGWNDVGFHGSNEIFTPNIDALAYTGVMLQNYYVMPICTPSRSALMTGMHPTHTGMQHRVLFGNEPWGLPLSFKTMADYLKSEGYKTHIVGKWHLGHYKAAYTPLMRGFDSHFGYWTGHQDYYDHTAQESQTYWGYDMRNNMNVSWDSYGKYSTDLFTEKAVDVITNHDDSNSSSPLFLFVSHVAVHSANPYQPLQAPSDVAEKFDHITNKNRQIFAGMVWKLDESVGKIAEALADKNFLDDTIIVFTTDNGGPADGFNSNAASNWPLRGVKDTLWEGGVRGSAFIWKKGLKAKISNHLMHIQDWLPTFLTAIGSRQNDGFDGKDLWRVISEENLESYEEILLNADPFRNISALRNGDWKIISGTTWNGKWDAWYGPGRESNLSYDDNSMRTSLAAKAMGKVGIRLPLYEDVRKIRGMATIDCKADDAATISSNVPCNLRDETCLYNVKLDPCEKNNMASDRPDILKDLRRKLRKYNVTRPINKPGVPASNPKFWNYTWTNWGDFLREEFP